MEHRKNRNGTIVTVKIIISLTSTNSQKIYATRLKEKSTSINAESPDLNGGQQNHKTLITQA